MILGLKNKIILVFLIFISALITSVNCVFAEYKVPRAIGYVNDYANVLDDTSKAKLNGILTELKQKTGAEVAVVTLTSLDGYPIEDVGLAIGRQWGVGEKGKANGVVIITAINDRKLRIEVGYGIEGYLTDAHAGRIRDTYMIPYFKQGDYKNGIIFGTTAVVDTISKGYGVNISGNYSLPTQTPQQDSGSDAASFIMFLIFMFLLIRYPSFTTGLLLGNVLGGGRSCGSGFGGGSSFGGFGGGGFGGGGASGGW